MGFGGQLRSIDASSLSGITFLPNFDSPLHANSTRPSSNLVFFPPEPQWETISEHTEDAEGEIIAIEEELLVRFLFLVVLEAHTSF